MVEFTAGSGLHFHQSSHHPCSFTSCPDPYLAIARATGIPLEISEGEQEYAVKR